MKIQKVLNIILYRPAPNRISIKHKTNFKTQKYSFVYNVND